MGHPFITVAGWRSFAGSGPASTVPLLVFVSEPTYLSGLDEVEVQKDFVEELFKFLGGEEAWDIEVLFVVAVMAEVAAWCLGNEHRWEMVAGIFRSRLNGGIPAPEMFAGRGCDTGSISRIRPAFNPAQAIQRCALLRQYEGGLNKLKSGYASILTSGTKLALLPLVVLPTSNHGFSVGLDVSQSHCTVSFNGWHEDFQKEDEALDCFAFGLSDECRLKECRRGNFAVSMDR